MARVDGVNRGLHVFASSIAIVSSLYTALRIYRTKKHQGMKAVLLALWLPSICIVFFYGLHETLWNPQYYLAQYLFSGKPSVVLSIVGGTLDGRNPLFEVQIAMLLFSLFYLRPFLRFNPLSWVPFVGFSAFWFFLGMPVTVPLPELATGAFANTLPNNILESSYTLTFGLGFCRLFK